jgi:hypothetical protein
MDTEFSEVARLLNSNIERLAVELLGKPSHRDKAELRFGKSGGISVVISGAKAAPGSISAGIAEVTGSS